MSEPTIPPPQDGEGEPSSQDASGGDATLISRRAVARTAAWSVPVVMAVAAAPLAAASPTGGIINFDSALYATGPGRTYPAITGTVKANVGTALPLTLTLNWPLGWSGPSSVTVNVDGSFAINGVVAPQTAGSGTLTASVSGFTPGSTTLAVQLNPVPAAVDGIVWGDNVFSIIYSSGSLIQTYAVTPDSLSGPGTLAPTSIIAMGGSYRG